MKYQIKRSLALTLAVLLLVSVFPISPTAFAEGEKVAIVLTPDNETIELGETVTYTVELDIRETANVGAFSFRIAFPDGLIFVSSQTNSSFKATTGLNIAVTNQNNNNAQATGSDVRKVYFNSTQNDDDYSIVGKYTLGTFTLTSVGGTIGAKVISSTSISNLTGTDVSTDNALSFFDFEAVTVTVNQVYTTLTVTNITAPALAGTPDTTADTDKTGVTVTGITYKTANEDALTGQQKFGPGRTYTATVTLTADAGYSFGAGVTPTVAGASQGGVTALQAGANNTYTFTATFPATETQALTVTGVTVGATKDYDGTVYVPFTGGTLSAPYTGDTVTLNTATATVTAASANAGTDIAVAATGFALAGTDAPKYTLTQPGVTPSTITINPIDPTYTVPEEKNIKVGSLLEKYKTIAPDTATGVLGEEVAGEVTWYSDEGLETVAGDTDVEDLEVGDDDIILYWVFDPTSPNYNTVSGQTTFTIVEGDDPGFAFAVPEVNKTYGDEPFQILPIFAPDPEADSENDDYGEITYAIKNDKTNIEVDEDGTVTILNVEDGEAEIVATLAQANGWAGATASYKVKIARKASTSNDFTLTIPDDAVYGSTSALTAAATAGVEGLGVITVLYNGSAAVPTNAGTYAITVTIAEGNNYAATTNPISVGNYTIAKKPLTITSAEIEDKTYDGTNSATVETVTFNGTVSSDLAAKGETTYTATGVFEDANAGEDKDVTVTVTLKDPNYSLATTTYTAQGTIEQATTEGVSHLLYVKAEGTTTLDLTKLLPSLASPRVLGGTVSYEIDEEYEIDGEILEEATVVNTTLTITGAEGATHSAQGDDAEIPIVVTSGNYEPFTVIVGVQITDKTPITIDLDIANKVYDRTAFEPNTPTVTSDIDTNELIYWYRSNDDGTYDAEDAPTVAGSYILWISVDEENEDYIGEFGFPFLITPKPITVTAADKTIVVGSDLPEYTFVTAPAALLITGDVWETNSAPALVGPSEDENETVGDYDITITPGNAGSNYDVTYVNGKLHVTLNNVATLSNLTLSSGTLSPAFTSVNTTYTASVANSVASVTVTPTLSDNDATYTINGGNSNSVSLTAGSSTAINVVVTAADGTTTKTYTITVTRAGSSSSGDTSSPSTPSSPSPSASPSPEASPSPASPASPAAPEVVAEVAVSVPEATVTTNEDGTVTAIVAVEAAVVENAIKEAVKAVEAAKEKGTENAIAEIVITITAGDPKEGEEAKHVTSPGLTLLVETVKAIADAQDVVLKIVSDVATITLDSATLAGIAEGNADNEVVKIIASEVPDNTQNDDLNAEQKEAVGDNTVIDLTVQVGSTVIHNFKGEATIASPYTPPAEVAEADYDLLTVYYVDDSGKLAEIKGAYFDPKTKQIVFKTTHFSKFMVSEWINPFPDISKSDWFYKTARFTYTNDLIAGIDGKFEAARKLTRGQMFTLLAKYAGVDTNGGETWYSKGVEWAVSIGISDGTAPERQITRGEMFQLVYNLAKYQGKDVSATSNLAGVPDADDISVYTQDGVKWAFATGLVSGDENGKLNSKTITTRVGVAGILKNYIEKAA
jgi:hypothetical protein